MVQLGEINLEDVIPSGIFTILDNAAKELTAEGRQPDYQAPEVDEAAQPSIMFCLPLRAA